MQVLARLIDRGPIPAAMLLAGLIAPLLHPATMLAFAGFSPLLLLLDAAVVAYLVLRRGVAATAQVAALALGLLFVLVLLAGGVSLQGVVMSSLLSWVPVAITAEVLRRSDRLEWAMLSAALLALVVLMAFSLLMPEAEAQWRELMRSAFSAAESRGTLDLADQQRLEQSVDQFARQMGSVLATTQALLVFGAVCLARHWQAVAVNPGGFRKAFHGFRLQRVEVLLLLTLFVVSLLMGGGVGNAVASVSVLALIVQGLAVVHALIARHGLGSGWLVAVYLLLLIPPATLLLVALGLVDNLLNLRER